MSGFEQPHTKMSSGVETVDMDPCPNMIVGPPTYVTVPKVGRLLGAARVRTK